MEGKINYWKNKRRKRLLNFLACLAIISVIFSLDLSTAYAQDSGQDARGKSAAITAEVQTMASQNGMWDALKGAARLAVLAPFLPVYAFITAILMPAANTLFVWAVKVDNFKMVVANPAIYTSWKIVRDFLNIAFILVLLFSAFATIFQVEKYSYKKILLNLVLMALLVNFSFPIARFIIDVSNVLMYTLMNMLFAEGQNGAGKALAMIGDKAGISAIMGGETNASIAAMLAAIIFGFIMAITMVAIGVMFVIRMIALAILIIFSPVAFVASILPATSSYASDWWNQLFKYAFFGPIMIFMLYIAVTTMQSMASVQASFKISAASESDAPNFIGNMAFFVIPIAILWIGMGTAQKMSIAGAGAVMGGAQKLIKGVGSQVSGLNYAKRQIGKFQESRKQRLAEKDKEGPGKGLGDWVNRRQDQILAKAPGNIGIKAQRRLETMQDTEVRNHMKDIDHITNGDELATLYTQARNVSQREAVMRRAASVGELETTLGRRGFSNDRVGFSAFMQRDFGSTDRSARLATAIASVESKNHNVQYSGAAAYNSAAHAYQYNTPAATEASRNSIFATAGGEHPQNVARGLRSGFILTANPGGPASYNQDFEHFLTDLGSDFHNHYNHRVSGGATGRDINKNSQLKEIPFSVIRQLQTARDDGINPAAGSRTEHLINQLVHAGRLRPRP